MLLTDIIHLDPIPSLAVILTILGLSVGASLVSDRRDAGRGRETDARGQVPG